MPCPQGREYEAGPLLCNQCGAAVPDFEAFRVHLKAHLEESGAGLRSLLGADLLGLLPPGPGTPLGALGPLGPLGNLPPPAADEHSAQPPSRRYGLHYFKRHQMSNCWVRESPTRQSRVRVPA